MRARPAAAQPVKWSRGPRRPSSRRPPTPPIATTTSTTRAPGRSEGALRPADALVDDYRAFQKRIGTTPQRPRPAVDLRHRQPGTLDALAAFGPTARRSSSSTTPSRSELKRMHGLGVRGIRFNLAQAGATTAEMIEPLSKRVNDLGWHIQINAPAAKIMEIMPILERVPSPIVFDHLAHIPRARRGQPPALREGASADGQGRTWVKLSGPTPTPRSGRRPMRTRARSRGRREGGAGAAVCGAATGRIRRSSEASSRTTPCCSTCSSTGRRTRGAAPDPGGEPGDAVRLPKGA